MNVRFVQTNQIDTTYGFGDARAPVEGESIWADGSDPDFPKGTYKVVSVGWTIGIRGPKEAVVKIKRATALGSR
jgi:hypothetical protein